MLTTVDKNGVKTHVIDGQAYEVFYDGTQKDIQLIGEYPRSTGIGIDHYSSPFRRNEGRLFRPSKRTPYKRVRVHKRVA